LRVGARGGGGGGGGGAGGVETFPPPPPPPQPASSPKTKTHISNVLVEVLMISSPLVYNKSNGALDAPIVLMKDPASRGLVF